MCKRLEDATPGADDGISSAPSDGVWDAPASLVGRKGEHMRRAVLFGGLVAAFVLGATLVSIASTPKVREPRVINVVEHADTDAVIDTGGVGDTSGDLLTFANPVYNASNTAQIGRDQGDCIRIDPAGGKWECRWITYVGGGGITVEGPFFDAKDSVMAITGGTGEFANVRGTMTLHALSLTSYRFTFQIQP
jgi:allene oxide cyclase